MNVVSGNAQRLKRAAAANLQKSRNPETLCVVNQAQDQILYRKGIKQNWLTDSIEHNTSNKTVFFFFARRD
jgi:hypothetical protein